MTLPLVSIVTPCFNAGRYIAETMRSVVGNTAFAKGSARLDYRIVDGGSRDDTLSQVESVVAAGLPAGVQVTVESAADRGMYDALAKGLAQARGQVCAYLNAGDLYSPHAVEIVLALMQQPSIEWLTGLRVSYNEASHLVSAVLPFRYRRELILAGCHDGRLLPHIQQESTFWSARLNAGIDFERLRGFRLAGDHFLWAGFAREHDLHVVQAWLGGFKVHGNQLSSDREAYEAELRAISGRSGALTRARARFERLLWDAPDALKRRWSSGFLHYFDFASREYVSHGKR